MRRLLAKLLDRRSEIAENQSAEAWAKPKHVFERIFRDNVWGHCESRSGEGASAAQTQFIRGVLPDLFAELGVTSMLDIPCGDWAWMRLLKLNINYTGADIVGEIVSRNQALYSNSNRRFCLLDITRDALPKVDLILCRDLLVHFSFEDIRASLKAISASGSRYLLTTTFPGRQPNTDIQTGRWRPLDLTAEPINLPEPLRVINERCTEWDGHWSDKSLGLWRIDSIQAPFS